MLDMSDVIAMIDMIDMIDEYTRQHPEIKDK